MPKNITRLTVFIASPGGLPENERGIVHDVCTSLNRMPFIRDNLIEFYPEGWETDVYSGVLDYHPQTDLSLLAENSDILIAIIHKKLGGSGHDSPSGTVDEIERALKRRETTGTAPEVIVYFREVDENLPDDDFVEVIKYKKKLQSRGDYPYLRTEDYKDARVFQLRLTETLAVHVDKWLKAQGKPGAFKIEDYENLITNVSQPLLNWPDTIDGKWIERPELDQLSEKIINAAQENKYSRSASLVLGDPGVGKSALLARLAKKLKEQGLQVLSIKADMVPASVSSKKELSDNLNLSMSIEDCIRQSTVKGPVVFIVDQLDAVSEIADRKSERLNLLLDLINSASSIDGVHVVTSCRIFEHRHDVRLSTINADVINLQLPSLNDVSGILTTRGINTEKLSSEVLELLRVPQHLKTFVNLLPNSTGRLDTARSIQDLYEELWQQKVERPINSAKRKELIGRFVQWMSNEEDLWAPLPVADGFHGIVSALEADQIFVKEGSRLGFRHQTFFDFALARRFVYGESLSEYVLNRQDGLFVRPIMLSTLNYLRATSRTKYHKELLELWNAPTLRNHLRILLDEKIASLHDPDEVEQGLVLPLLRNYRSTDKRYVRLLVSTSGSPGWFKSVSIVSLPTVLSLSAEEAWPCINILSSAWQFAHDSVLGLIESYLLPEKEKDAVALAIFQTIDNWDKRSVNLLCEIARRTYAYNIRFLADDISQCLPDLAPKIVRADIERRIEIAFKEDAVIPERPQIDEDLSENELVNYMLYEKNKALKKVFDLSTEWHDLSNIAESAPHSFLKEIWPLFLNALPFLIREPNPLINTYQDDAVSPHLDGRHSIYDGQLMVAIDTTIIVLAKSNQDAFLEFFRDNVNSQSLLVHRLLSRGLTNIAASKPDVVLEYLTRDPRRLAIGYFEDAHRESKGLLHEVVPFLDDEGRKSLEDAVLSFTYYSKDKVEWSAKERQDRQKWNREHRLRLLRAFPKDLLSPKTKRFYVEEERALPGTNDWDCRVGEVEWIGSPMSSERMGKASDRDILTLFEEIDDSTGWDHPRHHHRGGVIQASRELEAWAEKDPLRVSTLIRGFKIGKQEMAAGHAICGLAKSDFSPDKLISLIKEFDVKGFKNEDFRSDVSRALENLARKIHGLPDDVIDLLEKWFFSMPEPTFKDAEEDKNNNRSILWDYSRFITLGGGRAKVIDAIAKGYLWRKSPDLNGWADTIMRVTECEQHPDVWRIMSLEMPCLFNGDRNKATGIFDSVNKRLSQIGYSEEWVMAVARVLKFVTDRDVAHSWLIAIRDSEWKLGNRAFGELLVLWRCCYQDDIWGKQLLNDYLDKNDAEVCLGLAYSASHLWSYARFQETCTDMLVKLATSSDERIQTGIAGVCKYGEPLPLNKSMKRLIAAILPNDSLLLKAAESLIEGIEPLTTAEPDLVNKLCNRILDAGGDKIHNIASSFTLLAEPLVRISMTLHRMNSHRTAGLELFERLMDSNVNAARQALYLLDRRPVMNIVPQRVRQRRPRCKLR